MKTDGEDWELMVRYGSRHVLTLTCLRFARSYKEHACKYIFKFKNLDLGRVATGFALLDLPSMPELRKKRPKHFTPTEFDLTTLRYKDANREKQRQTNVKKQAEREPEEVDFSARRSRAKQSQKNEAW